jgi:hypothetical protein
LICTDSVLIDENRQEKTAIDRSRNRLQTGRVPNSAAAHTPVFIRMRDLSICVDSCLCGLAHPPPAGEQTGIDTNRPNPHIAANKTRHGTFQECPMPRSQAGATASRASPVM